MNQYFNSNEFGGQFYSYNQQAQAMPRVKNLLSNEEINMLRQKVEQFNLNLTPEEQLKGKCNHRDANGMLALAPSPDGTYRCTICGEVIVDHDYTEEEVTAIVEQANNVLNTVKLLYGEMPAAAASEFYMIQPLMKKLPRLMKIATANNAKYDSINQMNKYNNNNQFMMYNGIMGAPGMGMGMPTYYQQPAGYYDPNMGMQMAQPVQQPMAYQPQGAVAPDQNPFYATGYQQVPYQPQPAGFAYQPGMAPAQPVQPQVAPVAPAQPAPQPAANPQQGEVQVNTTLKA